MAKKRKLVVSPWAKKLKALRAQLELTQAEAAAKADVSLRTWIAWENAQRIPGRITQKLLKSAFPKINLD